MEPSVNVELHDLNHATLSIELWGSIWLYRRPEGRSWPIGTSLSVLPITFPWRYCREDHTTGCIKLTNGLIPLPSPCLRSPLPLPSLHFLSPLSFPSPPSPPFTSPSLPPSLHIHPPFPSLPSHPYPTPPPPWILRRYDILVFLQQYLWMASTVPMGVWDQYANSVMVWSPGGPPPCVWLQVVVPISFRCLNHRMVVCGTLKRLALSAVLKLVFLSLWTMVRP